MNNSCERLNVLHVTPSFGDAVVYGGPTTFANDLALALLANGHRVRVLTTDANGESRLDVDCGSWQVDKNGVEVRYCRRWAKHSKAPSLLWRLPAAIRWADTVVVSGVFSSSVIPSLLVCRLLRKPTGLIPHGSLMSYCLASGSRFKGLYLRIMRLVAMRQLVCICFSVKEALEATASTGFRSSAMLPVIVISPPRADLNRRGHGECVRLLFVGRLHPIKALESLIKAVHLAPITLSGLTVCLNVIGDGDPEYAGVLKALVTSLRLESRVKFLGQRTHDEVLSEMQNSDIFVLPSHSENFGRVVVEALGQGLPVIASTGTPWSILDKKKCGFHIPNSPVSLASVISQLDDSSLVEMSQRARIMAEEEFSDRAAAAEIVETIMRRPFDILK